MRHSINYKVVGRSGIAWALIQLFANLLFVAITTPAILLSQFVRNGNGLFLISALVLTLLIVGLTVGAYKKKGAYAFMLLASVAVWMVVAIYGLIFKNAIVESFAVLAPGFFLVTNTIYFGIMAVIVLFMSMGIWDQPPRKYRIPAIGSVVFLFVVVPIVTSAGFSHYNYSGSISGRIYQANGTIITTEVNLFCKPIDRNVYITHGDPAPPYLVIKAGGNYKIENLPKSDYYLWVADPEKNLFSDGFQVISVKQLHESELDFNLVPGGTISGSFLNDSENAEQGAGGNKWVAMYSTAPVSWSYTVDVNPDGTYSKTGLLPTEYQIYSNLIQRRPFDRIVIEKGTVTYHDFIISDKYP